MNNKAIFKKWWFWVMVVAILGVIGAATQPDGGPTSNNSSPQASQSSNSSPTLPMLNAEEYKGMEGLLVYKNLKAKGYIVEANFEKQALTDINGQASSVFEPLDPAKIDDRQSVDAFVVGNLEQNGDTVKLIIVQSAN